MDVQRVVRGILLQDDSALIVLRRKDRVDGGLWEFPGGKVEEGEHPLGAMAREFLEETGIQIAVVRLVDEHWWSSPQERTTFYCTMHLVKPLDTRVFPILNEESIKFAWTPLDRLAQRADVTWTVRLTAERLVTGL